MEKLEEENSEGAKAGAPQCSDAERAGEIVSQIVLTVDAANLTTIGRVFWTEVARKVAERPAFGAGKSVV